MQACTQPKLRGAIQDTAPGGRVMSKRLGAGFYSTRWALLPWAYGDDLRDRFELWQLDLLALERRHIRA